MRRFLKKYGLRLGLAAMAWAALGGPLTAAATAPTPGDSILIIYVNDPYNITFKNNIVAALSAIGAPFGGTPAITQLAIPLGDMDGIADQIPGADKNAYLSGFCQVWDLRFMDAHKTTASSGLVQEESINSGCATCDQELFLNFLSQGGHLYLQGDHREYYSRNEGLMSFLLASTGAAVGYPTVNPSAVYWATHDNTGPDNFLSNYDGINIGQIGTWYPGYVPAGSWGGGKALTRDGSNNALTLLWDAPQLATGNGKLAVNFDTNTFANDGNIAGANDWQRYVQHLYTTLSTCYNFELLKAVNDPGPVCVGETIFFTLCTENTGTRALPANQIWDTIPSCFTFQNSNPAPSSNTGALYRWNTPSITSGTTFCVTVNVLVANGGPCP